MATNEERIEGGQCGVPGHVPAHEVAVAAAFVVGTLTEDRERDVARVQVGQLRDLRGDPGAALALLRGRMAGVPHEVVGDQLRRPSNVSSKVTGPSEPISGVE